MTNKYNNNKMECIIIDYVYSIGMILQRQYDEFFTKKYKIKLNKIINKVDKETYKLDTIDKLNEYVDNIADLENNFGYIKASSFIEDNYIENEYFIDYIDYMYDEEVNINNFNTLLGALKFHLIVENICQLEN